MASRGQNVWYDLMTTDTEAAKRFYTEVLGWSTQQWEDSDPNNPYTMWLANGTPIGGVMRHSEEARAAGAPPHWLAYTVVDDVDETVELAEELEATVLRPAADIPKVGRYAILKDPQGAVFAVFKPEGDMSAPEEKVGRIGWAELNTTDYEAAWKFYSALFAWKERDKMDMGDMGTYFMFQDAEEKTKGGMSNVAKHMNLPPHWLHYTTVADMDATIERIKKNGGKVVNGPMPVPGGDTIAQCDDPQGAAFAVYAPGERS